jgi:putative Mg2+ transporter-C (MgtC) family protein
MMDLSDVTLWLCTTSLIGAGFGLNRDLHGKPSGVRTLGLVGFGSAFIVITFGQASTADASRVIQNGAT